VTVSNPRKRKTLGKLGWVCDQIADLLADQNATAADIVFPHDAKPGETVLERFQRFKALLNETIAQLNQSEARCCAKCNTLLPDAILDEMPWALSCRACAA
jgi:hypothetical protein